MITLAVEDAGYREVEGAQSWCEVPDGRNQSTDGHESEPSLARLLERGYSPVNKSTGV